MQKMKVSFQVARHDNAGHDNVGHENAGHEIATYFGIIVIINIVLYYPPRPKKTIHMKHKINTEHHKTT